MISSIFFNFHADRFHILQPSISSKQKREHWLNHKVYNFSTMMSTNFALTFIMTINYRKSRNFGYDLSKIFVERHTIWLIMMRIIFVLLGSGWAGK